ncbi:MAG: hypothetical protein LW719_01710 [Comamonadaceae bacterium]|jgi:hypothetical protein|nr:hypothetical protein [Comamonadaceae bacterium]
MAALHIPAYLGALATALSVMFPGASVRAQAQTAPGGLDRVHLQSSAKTQWVGLEYNTPLSRQVGNLKTQGYELSGGQIVQFKDWYSSPWQDLRLTWMTQIHSQLGLIWGLGTGERGKKYRIDPSLQLGFVYQQPLSKQSAWSLRAATRFGGGLREGTCVADYGDIGGVQSVNCRLAASELPPQETLKHLFNQAPHDRVTLNFRYSINF